MINVLVVGSGGREHALAWALARSPQVEQVYIAPGNGGTEWPAQRGMCACRNAPIAPDDSDGLVTFARARSVDLVVVGPELPLAAGLVDALQAAGVAAWGPTRAAARLEASKSFAKDFMRRHHIPTADYGVFDDAEAACAFVESFGRAVVVKADGLTAGKGVLVCDTPQQAQDAVRQIMMRRVFGEAGRRVVIEERLHGVEISLLAFCDGRTVLPMPTARDHKRAFDGDQGPNTGGMGAYSPAPDISAALVDEIRATVLLPAVEGMAAEGTPYVGVLYAGLMITPDGPRVLEFNCRFGDPETQAILPRLDSDLVDICWACLDGTLDRATMRWRPETCATVVLASGGYPGTYATGLPIRGLDDLPDRPDLVVFHAGTARQGAAVRTAGGRVLAVSALGSDLPAALNLAYEGVSRISFEGRHYRTDIGLSVVEAAR